MKAAILDHRGQPFATGERSLADVPKNRISQHFDSAQTTEQNSDYWGRADGMSARAAYSPGVRKVLRDRARYEIANNCYAKGMIRTYADYVVGTGPTIQILTDDKEYNDVVETRFHQWASAINFYRKLWTMAFAFVGDGEGFGVFHTNYRINNPVKLDLRLIEADQFADSLDNFTLDWKRDDGLILDDFDNVIGYKLLPYHPGDMRWEGPNIKPETLPARDVIHLYRCERPGQLRGVPQIAPALMLYPTLRRWTIAALNAAEHAAKISGVIHSTYDVTDPRPITPMEAIELEENYLLTLPAGHNMNQLKPEQPATTYPMFKKEIVSEIARCLNMPYIIAAASSIDANFASGKLDHTGWFKSVNIDEALIGDLAASRAFDRWHERAVLIDDYLPAAPEDFGTPNNLPPHIWQWDGQELIDPREADAQATALQNCITTYPELYAKRGLDWFDAMTAHAKSLGMTLEELQKANREKLYPPTPLAVQPGQAAKPNRMAGDTKESQSAQAA